MTTNQELADELAADAAKLLAVESQLEKARGEIENRLAVHINFDTSWALVPMFRFS